MEEIKTHRASGTFVPLTLYIMGTIVSLATVALADPPPPPPLPSINTNNVVNITNFGAISSTTLTNTAAIQAAINSAATTNGGCTVEIPAGTFLSGPLILKSSVNLQIDTNALLQMQPITAWPGGSFLGGTNIHDFEISGPGTIDGNARFGTGEWWGPIGGSPPGSRPNFIQFKTSSKILIQDVTLQNPPTFHIFIKNDNANITVQRITINTDGSSPNTDGFDIASTNVLIQNCYVSDGDDNVEIGGSQACAYVTVTNCTFGTGHGVSVGSITSGGVSNIYVLNCSFTGTDYGIRLKSDNAASSSGSGGLCRNFSFYNLTMTNIVKAPIVIYSYYNEVSTPTSVTPVTAATEPVDPVTSTTVIWRDITFSNLTLNTPGVIAGIIWGRLEMPVTNVVFSHMTNLSGAKTFDVYNAAGVQFVDSQINLAAGNPAFTLFNARVTITNSTYNPNLVLLDGLTTNGLGNILALYNTRDSLKLTNIFDNGPLTLADSLFTISNNLTLFPATVLNYTLDPNTNRVAVVGNLLLGGTINVTNGPGFGAGIYTLLTYGTNLTGSLPTLGSTPAGFNYAFDTNTAGQVNLVVSLPTPPAPTNLVALGTNLLINLKWNGVTGVTTYNLKRGTANGGPYPTVFSGLTATNYADANVTNTVTYYYVVTSTNAGAESTNSLPASATVLPSTVPTNIVTQASGGQLQLSWPQDHIGWKLEVQTNSMGVGLGTNWVVVPNSQFTNLITIPLDPANDSVFLRLSSQ